MIDEDVQRAHLDARDILRRSMSIASSVPSSTDLRVILNRRGINADRGEVIAACVRLALPLSDYP